MIADKTMYKGCINLPKTGENQVCYAGEKPEDEHDETKLP